METVVIKPYLKEVDIIRYDGREDYFRHIFCLDSSFFDGDVFKTLENFGGRDIAVMDDDICFYVLEKDMLDVISRETDGNIELFTGNCNMAFLDYVSFSDVFSLESCLYGNFLVAALLKQEKKASNPKKVISK